MARRALEFDTASFDKAMTELSRHSNRTAYEIVTLNSKMILKAIVFNSPRQTGTMNGGWLAAWNALGVPGYPKNKPRKQSDARLAAKMKRQYIADGSIVDNRRSIGDPSVEMQNKSHYIGGRGQRVNYPHIVAARTGFVRKAEAEVSQKFARMLDERYKRLLRSR